MIVGVPKEIKDNEFRVALVPAGAHGLVTHGHTVIIEKGAGEGSAISDEQYVSVGAKIVGSAKEVYEKSDMIVKVKEPVKNEPEMLREGQILFTYLHLAPLSDLTERLLKSKCIGIAYETVENERGYLPLLSPMSEVAGRMSIQVGAMYLAKTNGGRGILMGGVPGVPPADVVILGGGIVGINAAKMAVGMCARVIILDKSIDRLRYLDDIFQGRIQTLMSTTLYVAEALKKADLVIGAVLIPGAAAPKLVTREMISRMKKGSVVVDVSIDQGGCFETSHPTTHSEPTFLVDGVLHYCVANMPGAYPRTSTFALTNATFLYALKIADMGVTPAIKDDPFLASGVNVWLGNLTCKPVAEAQNRPHKPIESIFK